MDKNTVLGARPLLNARTILAAILLLLPAILRAQPAGPDLWAGNLQLNLERVSQAHSGELGVFIKDLHSGASVSLRGDEPWYLASGVKVPVAITVLQQVESGVLSLDSTVRLAETDYVDGAGQTNRHRPGSQLSIHFLLEQMLIYSDNTASDMLIGLVGLDAINSMLERQVPRGFGRVTTLADVRRSVYGGLHPEAARLRGRDFLRIRAVDERGRLGEFARVIAVPVEQFALGNIDSAYDLYYASHLNTGSLAAYGALLEALVRGQLLQAPMTAYLLELMTRTQTGSQRIKAGLPRSVQFAHKTGTQHRRICDFGIATGPIGRAAQDTASRLLIAACSRDFSSLADAEAALRQVGEVISASGVWSASSVTQAQAESANP